MSTNNVLECQLRKGKMFISKNRSFSSISRDSWTEILAGEIGQKRAEQIVE